MTPDCPEYEFWNNQTQICELCSSNQDVWGIFCWCVFSISSVTYCCVSSMAGWSAIINLIIACNITACRKKWDSSVLSMLVLIDIFILLFIMAIIGHECKIGVNRQSRRPRQSEMVLPSHSQKTKQMTNPTQNPVIQL